MRRTFVVLVLAALFCVGAVTGGARPLLTLAWGGGFYDAYALPAPPGYDAAALMFNLRTQLFGDAVFNLDDTFSVGAEAGFAVTVIGGGDPSYAGSSFADVLGRALLVIHLDPVIIEPYAGALVLTYLNFATGISAGVNFEAGTRVLFGAGLRGFYVEAGYAIGRASFLHFGLGVQLQL